MRGPRTEFVNAQNQDRLVDFEAQDLGLHQLERLAVHFDKSFTGLYVISQYGISRAYGRGIEGVPCSGRQLFIVSISPSHRCADRQGKHTSRSLLLAEALHALSSHVGRLWTACGEGGVGVCNSCRRSWVVSRGGQNQSVGLLKANLVWVRLAARAPDAALELHKRSSTSRDRR